VANNLIVSIDLSNPARNESAVARAIRSLGVAAQLQKTVWYIKTERPASEAGERLRAILEPADSLMVVDATNRFATWHNLDFKVSQFLQDQWYRARVAA